METRGLVKSRKMEACRKMLGHSLKLSRRTRSYIHRPIEALLLFPRQLFVVQGRNPGVPLKKGDLGGWNFSSYA